MVGHDKVLELNQISLELFQLKKGYLDQYKAVFFARDTHVRRRIACSVSDVLPQCDWLFWGEMLTGGN